MRIPSYRKHSTGQARVSINGRMIYLGEHNSDASREAYKRLIAEWLAAGETDSRPDDEEPFSIRDMSNAYLVYATEYYGDTPGSAVNSYRYALDHLGRLYGHLPACEFDSLGLIALQTDLIERGRSVTTINMHVGRIKRVFKWAASRKIIPIDVHQSLLTVEGVRKGRTKAKEAKRIPPVPDDIVEATLPYLPVVVADMVRIQRLTGSRPGEVCMMRPMDINRTGDIWTYRPSSHKTEHHGHDRVIAIGPKSQLVLMKYLLRDERLPCFSPAESERQRLVAQHAARVTPINEGNRPSGSANAKLGLTYDAGSYRKAVQRAAKHAGVARWSPHQLRHTAATAIRKEFGLEAAQATLGHQNIRVTEVYAERHMQQAIEVAKKLG